MNLHNIITEQNDPVLRDSLEIYIQERLPEFKEVYLSHPLKQPSMEGVSASEAFWLYSLVKGLKPKVIIESGTFEGYSLYFLKRGAPQAKIYAFDPLVKPKTIPDGAEYYACDWTEHDFGNIPGDETFVFFDDHMHQGRRLHQALRRGIRHLAFHDDYTSLSGSHVPIRFCDLQEKAKHFYIFDRLSQDPVFTDTKLNPQNYRWLSYLELDTELSAWRRWFRKLNCNIHMANPYKK